MKKYFKIPFIVTTILVLTFFLIYISGKNILPNLLDNTDIVDINSTSTSNEKLLDKKAPYFDLADLYGSRVKLDNYLNSPVIVVFWATWNSESTDQIKIIDDYLSSNNIENSFVKVIAIDSLEEASITKSFMRRGGYNVQIAQDTTGDTSNLYNIKSLPTTYFIDKDGIVKDIYTGVLSKNMVVDKVESILK